VTLFTADVWAVLVELHEAQTPPYMLAQEIDGRTVISAIPEAHVEATKRLVATIDAQKQQIADLTAELHASQEKVAEWWRVILKSSALTDDEVDAIRAVFGGP
jgi:anthranilate/para-aminobenzoate synthase component I